MVQDSCNSFEHQSDGPGTRLFASVQHGFSLSIAMLVILEYIRPDTVKQLRWWGRRTVAEKRLDVELDMSNGYGLEKIGAEQCEVSGL